MNLSYKTKWNADMPVHMAGNPTYFVEKINNALISAGICTISEIEKYESAFTSKFGHRLVSLPDEKHHTIREDSKNRWKAGNKIHFFINNRTPDMFRFAPIVEVKSTQKIEITHFDGAVCVGVESLEMEGVTTLCFYNKTESGYKQRWNGTDLIERIAINDGFDSVDDFFSWFNKDFTGKIIHWTNLKY